MGFEAVSAITGGGDAGNDGKPTNRRTLVPKAKAASTKLKPLKELDEYPAGESNPEPTD